MIVNNGVKHKSLNEETMHSIKEFFEKSPISQFNLRTLAGCFKDKEIYQFLLKLENESVLIRSKIDIKGNPVTHWQLKSTALQLPDFNDKSLPTNLITNGNDEHNPTNHCHHNANEISNHNLSSKSALPETDHSSNTNSKITKNEIVQNGKCRPPPRRLIGKQEPTISLMENGDKDKQPAIVENVMEDTPKTIQTQTCQEMTNSPIKNSKRAQSIRNIDKQVKFEDSNDLSQEIVTAIDKNPVSVLYEYCQLKGVTCQIECLKMTGPSHKPTISMQVCLNGRKFDSVVALNKKEGKKLAAELAIKQLVTEGQFTKTAPKSLVRAQLKKADTIIPKNDASMVEKIASLVCNELTILLRNLSFERRNSLAGRIVIAGIVMQDEKQGTLRAVALATGNRCITGDKISLQGKVVNDCHAEVVVRRSFMFFLYQQLTANMTSSDESLDIFEEYQEMSSLSMLRRFRIKAHIKFHLYISTAPCGDGAIFCSREKHASNLESELISSNKHKPTFEHPVQGLLRSKIEGGEGTIPVMNSNKPFLAQTLDGILRGERLKTMSCSDKIAKWNYVGLQGSLLTQFIEPVYLSSISIGNLYDHGHLSRAVCCRLDHTKFNQDKICDAVNHPDLGFVHTSGLQKETEKRSQFSVNWSYDMKLEIIDGVSGLLAGPEHNLACSRITKASLFHQYLKLFRVTGYNPFVNRYSYMDAKLLSTDYEKKKERLFKLFHKLEYGSWIRKPSEQNNFKDTLYN